MGQCLGAQAAHTADDNVTFMGEGPRRPLVSNGWFTLGCALEAMFGTLLGMLIVMAVVGVAAGWLRRWAQSEDSRANGRREKDEVEDNREGYQEESSSIWENAQKAVWYRYRRSVLRTKRGCRRKGYSMDMYQPMPSARLRTQWVRGEEGPPCQSCAPLLGVPLLAGGP